MVPESILSGAVTDADFVFEAVTEDLGIKNGLFKGMHAVCSSTCSDYSTPVYEALDLTYILDIASICSKETILCTSTLSLDLVDVFADVSNPEVGHGIHLWVGIFKKSLYCLTPPRGH